MRRGEAKTRPMTEYSLIRRLLPNTTHNASWPASFQGYLLWTIQRGAHCSQNESKDINMRGKSGNKGSETKRLSTRNVVDFKLAAVRVTNDPTGHQSYLANAVFLWTPSHFSAILVAAASAPSITGRLQHVSEVLARRSAETDIYDKSTACGRSRTAGPYLETIGHIS